MANVLKFEAVIILNKSGSDRTKKKLMINAEAVA